MKPVVARSWALLLCCFCFSAVSACTPLSEDSSGLRLWVADLPNPFDRDRPRPLARVTRFAKAGKAKKIYVEGEVLRLSPLLDGMAYEIQDSTGKIWIQTPRQDVSLGEIVHVQGLLHQREASVGGQDFGEAYLEELRQVESD